MKTLIQLTLFFSILLSAGCRWAVTVDCPGGGKCGGGIEISNQKTGDGTNDSVTLKIDSNLVRFVTQEGKFLLKAQNGTSLLGAKQFTFVKSGNEYVPYNRNEINSWLQQFNGESDRLLIEFTDLAYDSSRGGEDVQFSVQRNGSTVASSTTYISRHIGGGYCEGSICYDPK